MPYVLQQVLSRVLFEFYSSFIQGRSTDRQCSVRRWRSSAEAREHTPGKSRRDMRGPKARAMTAAAQTHVHLPLGRGILHRGRLARTCVSMCHTRHRPLEAHASRRWHLLGRLRTAPAPQASLKVRTCWQDLQRHRHRRPQSICFVRLWMSDHATMSSLSASRRRPHFPRNLDHARWQVCTAASVVLCATSVRLATQGPVDG